MSAGCCTFDETRLAHAGDTLLAAPRAPWRDPAFAYRRTVRVRSSALAGPGVEATILTVPLEGTEPSRRAADGTDLRAWSPDGMAIPVQVEDPVDALATQLRVVTSWNTALSEEGELYTGAPSATPAPSRLGISITPGVQAMVTRDNAAILRVDLDANRNLTWGRGEGSITGLWTGGEAYLGNLAAIRDASLFYNGGGSEGDMRSVTVLAARAGPAAVVLEVSGRDAEVRFEHRLRYLVFAHDHAWVRGTIKALGTSTAGMDIFRAPMPAILGTNAQYPGWSSGAAAGEGWMDLRGLLSAGVAQTLSVVVPGNPSAVTRRFGHDSTLVPLDPLVFFPGFGGWRAAPLVNNTQFGGLVGGLSTDPVAVEYRVAFGRGDVGTIGRPAWLRATHPPAVELGPWEDLDEFRAATVTLQRPASCVVPLDLQVSPADAALGIQLSRDGMSWFRAVGSAWLPVQGPRDAASVEDSNLFLDNFGVLDGARVHVRVVMPVVPAGPALASVSLLCGN